MFDGWEVIQVSSRLAVRSNLRRSHNLGLLVPVDLSRADGLALVLARQALTRKIQIVVAPDSNAKLTRCALL